MVRAIHHTVAVVIAGAGIRSIPVLVAAQGADATQRKNQKQASRKKKSFWRKLLPF